jgi:cytochrome c553
MKKIICIIILVKLALLNAVLAEPELTAELKNGKEKALTICSACHGLNGQAASAGNSVLIPNITAQQKNYLVTRLKSYKSGEIKHPQMTVVAQMLSDKDIDDVSEWYSRIKITIADPEVEIAAPK